MESRAPEVRGGCRGEEQVAGGVKGLEDVGEEGGAVGPAGLHQLHVQRAQALHKSLRNTCGMTAYNPLRTQTLHP